MKLKNKYLLFLAFAATVIVSCSDQWDNHVKVEDKVLAGNLLDAISEIDNLSTFYGMIKEVGYDDLLASNNELTVLAPSNEALASYSSSSKEEKLAIVKNHISYLSYSAEILSGMTALKMINDKNLDLSGFSFNSSTGNILCDNGIIHQVGLTVKPAMNILEFLESVKGNYLQVDTLLFHTDSVMDMDKSIQISVDPITSLPVYDTVRVAYNHFFEKFDISDEDQSYEFVVLENENFRTIRDKYAKYMQQSTEQQVDSLSTDELIQDLVFLPGSDTAVSGVKVDFSGATTVSEYIASNGKVKVMRGVDIKLKENKIKSVIIEGEDFLSCLNETPLLVRYRPQWASPFGEGYDVMLSGRAQQKRDSIDANGDPVLNEKGEVITITTTFNYETTNGTFSTDINYYIEYKARLNSVDYKISWVAYDDISSHAPANGLYPTDTLQLYQKLFISLPGERVLNRNTSGRIENNCYEDMAFVGYSKAGVLEEVTLQKYKLGTAATQLVSDPYEGEDKETLSVPVMGDATFFLCNTIKESGTYSGPLFLDYIRLEPQIED